MSSLTSVLRDLSLYHKYVPRPFEISGESLLQRQTIKTDDIFMLPLDMKMNSWVKSMTESVIFICLNYNALS